MKQRRLYLLLATMVALLALRWWVPPRDGEQPEVSAAVVRPVAAASVASMPEAGAPSVSEDLAAGTRDPDPQDLRNAFAVRVARAVPAVPSAPPPLKPFVGPPLPPPPPPPPQAPFQVIGSWSDEQGPSVFLAGPRGVVQGRVGDLLAAEYRLTQISPQRVLLKHLPTNRDVPLAVPSGSASPLLTSSK